MQVSSSFNDWLGEKNSISLRTTVITLSSILFKNQGKIYDRAILY